ncbi:MAG: hypothetical protein O2794_02775 [bacterium]|nr:hypothetical protein [bacterium]
MKTFSQEEVLSRYERLPRRVRDALFASATTDKMLNIGKRHGLMLDKVGVLAEETGYVMLGLTSPQNFAGRLTESLGITQAQAKAVVDDVNSEVFKEIQENLKTAPNEEPETELIPQHPKSFATHVREKAVPTPPQQPVEIKETRPLQPPIIKPAPKPSVEKTAIPSIIFPEKGGSGSTIPSAPKFESKEPVVQEQAPVVQKPPTLSTPNKPGTKTATQSKNSDPYREEVE